MTVIKLAGWVYWHAPGDIMRGIFQWCEDVTWFEARSSAPENYTEYKLPEEWTFRIGLRFAHEQAQSVTLRLGTSDWTFVPHKLGVLVREKKRDGIRMV